MDNCQEAQVTRWCLLFGSFSGNVRDRFRMLQRCLKRVSMVRRPLRVYAYHPLRRYTRSRGVGNTHTQHQAHAPKVVVYVTVPYVLLECPQFHPARLRLAIGPLGLLSHYLHRGIRLVVHHKQGSPDICFTDERSWCHVGSVVTSKVTAHHSIAWTQPSHCRSMGRPALQRWAGSKVTADLP